jgi:adenylate cyclase
MRSSWRSVTGSTFSRIRDNPRLYALLASMLRNNRQLYSLYAGYDDGRFVQMDYLERGGEMARLRNEAPQEAKFRLVVISGAAAPDSSIDFLRDDLTTIVRRPGPTDYDPRRRPWYAGAFVALIWAHVAAPARHKSAEQP